jgi:NAD(P)H dehydrogenase (quinone)
MGNVLVLYDSQTGNTEKMAHYVAQGAEGVPDTVVRVRSVEEATREDILWCDGLAVGAPTYLGLLSWRMKRFWDELTPQAWGRVDGKIACVFSSSGGWGGGAELTCLSLLVLLINFGFLVFGVPDYVADRFTLHYGAVTAGEPAEEKGGAACVRLGQRLAQWVAVFVDGREELGPGPVGQR